MNYVFEKPNYPSFLHGIYIISTFSLLFQKIDRNRKVPKTQEKDTGSNHLVPVMLAFYNTDRKTVKERSIYRSRVCINSKEHENVMSFRRHIIGPPWVLGIWGEWLLFSGSWEALVIIFRDFGSKLIVLGI